MSPGRSLLATKSIERLVSEAGTGGEHGLQRVLGPTRLVMLGIGDIIGAGIFVLTGLAAAQYGGPPSSCLSCSPRWPAASRASATRSLPP